MTIPSARLGRGHRVLLAAALSASFLACSGGGGSGVPGTTSTTARAVGTPDGAASVDPPLCVDASPAPTVDAMSLLPAVSLVRGSSGPIRLAEVNVTQTEVNVFVVRDGRVYAYVVCGDRVIEPGDDGDEYAGETFADNEIDITPQVLTKVEATIRDSHVVALSLVPGPDDRIDYIATLTAPGGEFRVLLAPDGSVLATE